MHVGWRGLLAGVVDAAVRIVRERGGAPVRAVVGPCISPAHYEFGADELEHVTRRLGPAVAGRTETGAPALDLRAGVGVGARVGGRGRPHRRGRLHVRVGRPLLAPPRRRHGPSGADRDSRRVSDVAAAIAEVRSRIAGAARRAGREPDAVRLVAATKTVPAERVAEAVALGVTDVGENRAQELLAKADLLAATAPSTPADVCWHFLGRLQRNKVRSLAGRVTWWQSVDREALGRRHRPPRPRSAGARRGEPGATSRRRAGAHRPTPAGSPTRSGSRACASRAS